MILDIALSCLQDLRPIIPADTHPMLAGLLQKCWQKDPALRPTFSEILDILNSIKEVCIFDGMSIKFLSSICVFLSFDFFFILCNQQAVRSSGHQKRHSGRSYSRQRRSG